MLLCRVTQYPSVESDEAVPTPSVSVSNSSCDPLIDNRTPNCRINMYRSLHSLQIIHPPPTAHVVTIHTNRTQLQQLQAHRTPPLQHAYFKQMNPSQKPTSFSCTLHTQSRKPSATQNSSPNPSHQHTTDAGREPALSIEK